MQGDKNVNLNPLDNLQLQINKDASVVAVYLSKTAISESIKAEEVKDHIINALKQGMQKVIVDLGLCNSVEATFIGVLITSLNKFISENKNYKLSVKLDGKSSILELSRISNIFKNNNDLNSDFEEFCEN